MIRIFIHCIMIIWIILNLWLAKPYIIYHWYNYSLGIFILFLNPVMFCIAPKMGQLKERLFYLYVYPSLVLLIITLGPVFLDLFYRKSAAHSDFVAISITATDILYIVFCIAVYVISLRYYRPCRVTH